MHITITSSLPPIWAFPPRLFSSGPFCLFLPARSVHSSPANATSNVSSHLAAWAVSWPSCSTALRTLIYTFPQTLFFSRRYWAWLFRSVCRMHNLGAPKLPRKLQLMLKRVFDLALSLLGLVVLVPVFALIALCISLDSSGDVFFKLRVAGRDGKPFYQRKF